MMVSIDTMFAIAVSPVMPVTPVPDPSAGAASVTESGPHQKLSVVPVSDAIVDVTLARTGTPVGTPLKACVTRVVATTIAPPVSKTGAAQVNTSPTWVKPRNCADAFVFTEPMRRNCV